MPRYRRPIQRKPVNAALPIDCGQPRPRTRTQRHSGAAPSQSRFPTPAALPPPSLQSPSSRPQRMARTPATTRAESPAARAAAPTPSPQSLQSLTSFQFKSARSLCKAPNKPPSGPPPATFSYRKPNPEGRKQAQTKPRALNLRRLQLLACPVLNHPHLLQGQQTSAHHLVQ